MNSQNDNNFFDKKTLISIGLVGILFFGWQKYLEHKYPDFYKKKEGVPAEQVPGEQKPDVAAPAVVANEQKPVAAASTSTNLPESKIGLQFPTFVTEVSSKGMGLKNWTLTEYKDREKNPVQFAPEGKPSLFALSLVGRTEGLDFKLEKVSDTVVKGTAEVDGSKIEQTLTFVPETLSIQSQISVSKATPSFKGLTISLSEEKQKHADGTWFLPSMEHQEFVVRHQGKLERVNGSSSKEAVEQSFEQVGLVAIGSQYFASAFVDQSQTIPEVSVHAPITGVLGATVSYKPATVSEQMNFAWTGYAGPKSLEKLQAVSPQMEEVVNFGFFASIGKVLLFVLKWFHTYVGNWGVAIILLTLLVRMIVLPFNITSYKSMKKMQKIQPQMQSLRERYKDDPTAMNRETMALMREQKVNPIGGCLPMLLQMPVFFALYQVLGQSIDLYQAPFFAWIHDLSLKDPFYVLPVLMGITMFIQQKITPTTMDPQQAKILQWMPIIFSVFTLGLPAGLTLYIFISTLFGVIQQRVFMRDSSPAVSTKPATAK